MTPITRGTVVITGPTSGLGRAATLDLARRPSDDRPDLILVGRPGAGLDDVADAARETSATVVPIGCDLARLSDVRNAARRVREAVQDGEVRPLRAVIANAGVTVADTHTASADGYEMTFAVNYLAHAQLIGDLVELMSPPARIVMIGSNTYHQNFFRRMLHVPGAQWRDAMELARPTPADVPATRTAAGIAYSNSKLAILHYAHELQRRAPSGVSTVVFEPGFMPGTALSRAHGSGLQRFGRLVERIPGVSAPSSSGPLLASVTVDDRWSRLRDGAFVVKDRRREVEASARNPERERRLWDDTAELLGAVR